MKFLSGMFLSLFAASAFAAEVMTFDFEGWRIYAIQDAPTRPKASLFTSVNPSEPFRQSTADYAGSVNVFIVENTANRQRLMIDAGFGAPMGRLVETMRKAGLEPDSVSDILITHIHPDHVGGLKAFPKAKIHIAGLEYREWLRDRSRAKLGRFLPEEKELRLFDYGEVMPGVTAIKCAGHTPGHTVFRIGDIWFVGDIVHAADLQIAHPDFCAAYDMNPAEAAASRRRALSEFHGTWFGAHIPFPGRLLRPAQK